jgi:small subunit ribosomal protein S9
MSNELTERYIEAVGRRKTAVARVRIVPSPKAGISVNGRTVVEHFPIREHQIIIDEPFSETKLTQKFTVEAKIYGGGVSAQAEALRHGLARALVKYDAELRKPVKKAGFLKRDPRMKERRKFGLKKARKAPQWSKR